MTLKKVKQGGFSLVELLIVVIILALLSAIVIPQFAASTDDAASSAADTSLSNLRAALDLYYQQHGEYPGSLTSAPSAACAGTSGGGAADSDTAFLEQLSLYTDQDGGACSVADANHRFGPYIKKQQLENEPFGNSNAIEIATAGDLNMGASVGDPGGYKYDVKTGKVIINIAAEAGR
jgi:prepilin-type N-terminal cleavage/methylation domain-containing protein